MDLQGTLNQLAGTSGVDAQGAAALLVGTATALADEGLVAADVAKASAFNFFAASEFMSCFDSTTFAALSGPFVLMDDASVEGVQVISEVPSSWTTYELKALLLSPTGEAANVRLQGGQLATGGTAVTVGMTAAAFALQVASLGTYSLESISGLKFALPFVKRLGDNVADVFVGDLGLVGIRIAKAS